MRGKVLKRQASQSDDTRTLYKKDRELFDKGQEYISNFVSKNASWEVQKALAIQIMASAMTELGKGIVDAAKFAATTTYWFFSRSCTQMGLCILHGIRSVPWLTQ